MLAKNALAILVVPTLLVAGAGVSRAQGRRAREVAPRERRRSEKTRRRRRRSSQRQRRRAVRRGRRQPRRGGVTRGGDLLRRFRMEEGRNVHSFHQSRRLSAHTIIRRGSHPRIVVATPAGNSGVGIWFHDVSRNAGELSLESEPREVEHAGVTGLAFDVSGPARLELRRVLLDSVRSLRDEGAGTYGKRVETIDKALAALDRAPRGSGAGRLKTILRRWIEPEVSKGKDGSLVLERTSPAGARYRLELHPLDGTRIRGSGRKATLRGRDRTRFQVRVFIDRKPLTPFREVLSGDARKNNRQAERDLGFLSYKEAFLAGSWQYLTYFGRDTLITNSLLSRVAQPETLSAAVTSVLDRVSRRGEVAHEENVGDEAAFERIVSFAREVGAGRAKVTDRTLKALEKPVYDYKMVDGEYLLPQVVDAYLQRAGERGVRDTFTPERVEALARVAARVEKQTARFARDPKSGALVRLRRGEPVGNWRDSEIGLGGGRTPLDVNAYLAPAALEAFARILDRPGFPKRQFLRALSRTSRRAARLFSSEKALSARSKRWLRAREAFEVDLGESEARRRLKRYFDSLPEKDRDALAGQKLWSGKTVGEVILGGARAPELEHLSFPAIALDAKGRPIPIENSDPVFDLFYGRPTREQVIETVEQMFQPFPIGLATPVGLVVSNPAYSNRRGDAETFANDKYHGSVIWGWPQKMVLQGLERQAERFKGDPKVQKTLRRARRQLTRALERAGHFSSSEVWTWTGDGRRVRPVAFGESAGDSDEANPLQFWTLPP